MNLAAKTAPSCPFSTFTSFVGTLPAPALLIFGFVRVEGSADGVEKGGKNLGRINKNLNWGSQPKGSRYDFPFVFSKNPDKIWVMTRIGPDRMVGLSIGPTEPGNTRSESN